ncbi:hypothetical protein D3C87_1553500 [compost metagenome]
MIGDEFRTDPDIDGGAFKKGRKGFRLRSCRHKQIVTADVAQADMVGGETFAIVIDDCRKHGRALRMRGYALLMGNAVLQDGNRRLRRAEAFQPRGGRGHILCLGAKDHPVDRFGATWLRQCL